MESGAVEIGGGILLTAQSNIAWDGQITLGVLDENLVRRLNLQDILLQIRAGNLSWKRQLRQSNKVTDYARQYLVKALLNTLPYPLIIPTLMELGTGTSTYGPQGSDKDLWSPAAGTLKQTTTTQQYLTYYAQYICSWQTSDPIVGTWTEIGLKDSAGNLWAHAQLTSALPVYAGEMLVGQWQVQVLGN